MLNQQEKYSILKKEFQDILTKGDILDFLDYKCGHEFDRGIAIQLFDFMEKNNHTTVDGFIQTYIEAEGVLLSKIEKIKQYLDDFYQQKNEAELKFSLVKQQEKLNQYGIMKDSVLTLTIQEIQNIETNVYVVMQCGKNRSQTSIAQQPQWNETFQFPIEEGNEEIMIKVHGYEGDFKGKERILGICTISLDSLADQQRKDLSLPLTNGQSTRSVLVIQALWMHSRTKYLDNVVMRWTQYIQMQEDDLLDYRRDLDTLYEPFPLLQKKQNFVEATNHIQSSPEPDNLLEIYQASQYIAGALSILVLLGLFNRALYLDCTILMSFGYLYLNNQLDSSNLKQIAAGELFSFVIDLPYLLIFGESYWSAGGVDEFVMIVSILIFFVKLSFIGICGYLSTQMNDQVLFSDRPSQAINILDNSRLSYIEPFPRY